MMIAQAALAVVGEIDRHIRYFAAYKKLKQQERALKKLAKYQERMSEIQGEAILQEAMGQELILNVQASRTKLDAQRAKDTGEKRAEEVREGGRRAVGSFVAKTASSGVDVSQGSPMLVQSELFYQTERQANAEEFIGQTAARALNYQAEEQQYAARNIRAAGHREKRFTLLGGQFQAAGTRLEAFAVAMKRSQLAAEKSQKDIEKTQEFMSMGSMIGNSGNFGGTSGMAMPTGG